MKITQTISWVSPRPIPSLPTHSPPYNVPSALTLSLYPSLSLSFLLLFRLCPWSLFEPKAGNSSCCFHSLSLSLFLFPSFLFLSLSLFTTLFCHATHKHGCNLCGDSTRPARVVQPHSHSRSHPIPRGSEKLPGSRSRRCWCPRNSQYKHINPVY